MAVVQNIILPAIELQVPLNMYFRVDKTDFLPSDDRESRAQYNYNTKTLSLKQGHKYCFNTYYNGLSVNIWKQNCAIDSLSLRLRGRGKVQVELAVMTHEFDVAHCRKDILTHKVLEQKTVSLSADGTVIPIEKWENLKYGQLYITLSAADGDAEFYGGSFETEQKPARDVKLGIVITHYNRKHYVLPAIQRLKQDILDNPYYGKHINLAIIDNSRNITAAEAPGITVLPNPNYGGAGGFSRGLLHWKDKEYSHCLFMDDDASCETESIYRTLSLLQYAHYDNLAVSGALLREAEPYLLWAKGEYFKNFCSVSPKRGLDMRFAPHLLFAEQDDAHMQTKYNYGGFWHFAFPIAGVKQYPFPFFVRGDDILFGLSNDFRIITMNGIGNYADDFSLKESPFSSYLNLRGNFTLETVAGSASPYQFIRRYKRGVRHQLSAYNYSHARAFSLSVADFMKGLPFWRDNMDISEIRKRLAAEASGEVMREQDEPARGKMRAPHGENPLRKLFRKLTEQGFLLPGFMIKNKTALLPKNFCGGPEASFRFRRIFYYGDDLRHGYYADYDKKRFFAEKRLCQKMCRQMKRELPAILTDYRKNWKTLATEQFWREVYSAELSSAVKLRA